MANDLRDLIHALGEEPEGAPIEFHDVLRQGQRRVRRRRVLTGAGIGVAAVCVVAASLVVADVRSASGPVGPSDVNPSTTIPTVTAPTFHAQVVTVGQAQSAVLGRDYDVVADHLPDGVTAPIVSDPDGDMLVSSQDGGQRTLTDRIGVVPEGSLQPTWFSSPTGAPFRLLQKPALSRSWVAFATADEAYHADEVFAVDRVTGAQRQVLGGMFQAGGRTFSSAEIGDIVVTDGGTVFLLVFDGGDPWLVSRPADGGGAPTLVGPIPSGEMDAAGDLLVTVQNEPTAAVEVTDTVTGTRTPVRLPPDQEGECRVSRVEAATEHVGLVVDCQDPTRRLIDVYDAAGHPLWVVDPDTSAVPTSFTDKGMVWVPDDGQGRLGAPLWFAFADGRFLRFDAYGVLPEGMVQAGDALWAHGTPPAGQPRDPRARLRRPPGEVIVSCACCGGRCPRDPPSSITVGGCPR